MVTLHRLHKLAISLISHNRALDVLTRFAQQLLGSAGDLLPLPKYRCFPSRLCFTVDLNTVPPIYLTSNLLPLTQLSSDAVISLLRTVESCIPTWTKDLF
jgi:hypothetical protein